MRFELGQKVRVKARVDTGYEDDRLIIGLYIQEREKNPRFTVMHKPNMGRDRCLFRLELEEPVEGAIIGYAWRLTGRYFASNGNYSDWSPAYLQEDRRFKVWMIATTLRWKKPLLVLEEDIIEMTNDSAS